MVFIYVLQKRGNFIFQKSVSVIRKFLSHVKAKLHTNIIFLATAAACICILYWILFFKKSHYHHNLLNRAHPMAKNEIEYRKRIFSNKKKKKGKKKAQKTLWRPTFLISFLIQIILTRPCSNAVRDLCVSFGGIFSVNKGVKKKRAKGVC